MKPTLVHVDNWHDDANRGHATDPDFLRQFHGDAFSRDSTAALDGETAYPLPEIFDRVANIEVTTDQVEDTLDNRVKELQGACLAVAFGEDSDSEPLTASWVQAQQPDKILELIEQLFAQRDSAVGLCFDMSRIIGYQSHFAKLSLGRVREWEAHPTADPEALGDLEEALEKEKARATELATSWNDAREQLAAKNERILALIDERDALQGHRRQTTPNPDDPVESIEDPPRAPRTARTAKIADPEKFTNGTSPKLAVWKSAVKRKFEGNADQFPSDATKFAYAVSWIGGEAAEALQVYLDIEDSDKAITTTAALFQFLDDFFTDPTERDKASNDFDSLRMSQGTDYKAFHTAFIQAAHKAYIPKDRWKREFNNRLSKRIQYGLIRDFISDNVGFEEFARTGHQLALQYSVIDSKERPAAGGSGTPTGKPAGKAGKKPAGASGSTGKPRQGTPAPNREKLGSTERDELMAAGKCFYCKKEGHTKANCPDRLAAAIRLIEAQGEARKPRKAAPEPASEQEGSDSEN